MLQEIVHLFFRDNAAGVVLLRCSFSSLLDDVDRMRWFESVSRQQIFRRGWMIAEQLAGMCWFSVDTSNNVTVIGSCHKNLQNRRLLLFSSP